jgi:predicted ATPase/transcriptional regulator with XRE-family HTH domain
MMGFESPSIFGDVLRRLRIAAGLTQEALAERSGLSVRGISDLERGVNRSPRKDTLTLLAEALRLNGAARDAFFDAGMPKPRGAPTAAEALSPSNLPTPLTRIIGRSADSADVTAMLKRPGVRFVTLTGPGGVGKTRLAIQVASDVRAQFPEGVWFVGLADLSRPDQVLPAIAQSFRLAQTGERSIGEQLADYVASKRMLLVLDNFEHLRDAGPMVTELLRSCANLSLLVTSRSPLKVSGEHERLVSPLAVPDPRHLPGEGDLSRYPAVQLFLERVQAVRPDFRMSAENAPAIARICAQLDGLPLAIELAAARIKVLPPEAMVERLRQRLQFLSDGTRDAPQRQRTLRNTLAWSHDLLNPAEQQLFRCLGVFRGGWTLEAAESICTSLPGGTCGQPVESVLERMSELVDSNLVWSDANQGIPRFGMLETTREYAIELLADSGDGLDHRQRHAQSFLAFAERLDLGLRSSERLIWSIRLLAELDNLRAAFRFTIERSDAETAMKFALLSYWPWMHLGLFREGRAMCEAALALAGAERDELTYSRTLIVLGGFAWHLGDYRSALHRLQDGKLRCAALGDRLGLGLATQFLGLVALSRGERTIAQRHMQESIEHFQAVADTWNYSNALFILGDTLAIERPEEAETHYAASLSHFRQLRDPWGIAWPLTGLGGLALRRSDTAMARAHFLEALELRRLVRDRWGTAISLTCLGEVALLDGKLDDAESLLREGLQLFRELGDLGRIAWALHVLGRAAESRLDHRSAGAAFAESLDLRRAEGNQNGMADSLAALARVAAVTGSPQLAVQLFSASSSLRGVETAAESPDERSENERYLDTVAAALDPALLESAWASGRLTDTEHVTTLAIHFGTSLLTNASC